SAGIPPDRRSASGARAQLLEVAKSDPRRLRRLRSIAVELEQMLYEALLELVDDPVACLRERQARANQHVEEVRGAVRSDHRQALEERHVTERLKPRDRVPELADVARPGVVLPASQRRPGQRRGFASELDPERLCEQGDVAASMPER